MIRVRFHGRGGQGVKTASRILGSALFAEGFEVQDAPRYGAERRGAPIFATVRADRKPIRERGVIPRPHLVVCADETLLPVATAGVLAGLAPASCLLIASDAAADAWRERLAFGGRVLTLPGEGGGTAVGAACAGAAARLVGVIARESLERAVDEEIEPLGVAALDAAREHALAAYDRMAAHHGVVREGDATAGEPPAWIELPFESARLSAPDITRPATSVQVRTGLWRSHRPVIDPERCHRCSWICTTFCPDGAIAADADGAPQIDYDHCKGCMVCVAVCPPHAIAAVPEREARAAEEPAP